MSRKLKPKQLRAAQMLAAGATASYTARQLRMRAETLSRWKKIPEFNFEIEKLMLENRAVLRHKLAHLAEAAIEAVWSELHDYSYGSQRLKAALGVLKGGITWDAGAPEQARKGELNAHLDDVLVGVDDAVADGDHGIQG